VKLSSFSILLVACACGARSSTPPPPAPAHAAHAHGEHGAHAGHGEHGHAGVQHASGMRHRFERADEWTKMFDDPARDAWQQPERVIAEMGLTPMMTVADVGAGTGYFAVRIARQVPQGQVIATDIEPDMVRYMTERAQREKLPNLRATLATATDAGLAPASVDRVLIVDVWHHLGDRVAYAKTLAAALKPGGKLFVVDFQLDSERGPPKEHKLAPAAIIADLRAAGFTATLSPTTLPDQYIITASRTGA
jgi:2-polyprenyl-3-methyl-5-hydroxy-6-metoxy-1,4-benzoquinol methylase